MVRLWRFHKLYRLSDCDLHRRGKMVVSAANKYFDVLSERGFREEDITELANIVDAFDASIYNKYDAVTKRDVSTEERLVLSNALYKAFPKLVLIVLNLIRFLYSLKTSFCAGL